MIAKEKAIQASRAKSEFLATVSHELRTPLNAIIGFSEIIEREILGPVGTAAYAEYAANIRGSGLLLLNLINDILDLAKIEAGRFELADDVLALPDHVDNVIRVIQPIASRNDVAVCADIEDELPRLRADARATDQMLLNLLSNAVKFTAPGGRVTIRAYANHEGICLAVEDTGNGIDPAHLARVLSPFEQAAAPSPGFADKGTGLGLSIVRSLLELHGGRLDIQSELGVGTTVALNFPAWRISF
jgi:signal transduction histidine kinase